MLFPTAQQVAATPQAALRSAGLSQRKAEYLHDLAAHFADGRITTQKLREATDEQLSEMLIVHKDAVFNIMLAATAEWRAERNYIKDEDKDEIMENGAIADPPVTPKARHTSRGSARSPPSVQTQGHAATTVGQQSRSAHLASPLIISPAKQTLPPSSPGKRDQTHSRNEYM